MTCSPGDLRAGAAPLKVVDEDIADPKHVRALLVEAEAQQAEICARIDTLRLVLAVLEGKPVATARPAPRGALTPRQSEVARLVAEGAPNAEIARALSMSENTVRIHVSAILKALSLSNRTQLALWWREHGTETAHG